MVEVIVGLQYLLDHDAAVLFTDHILQLSSQPFPTAVKPFLCELLHSCLQTTVLAVNDTTDRQCTWIKSVGHILSHIQAT